MDLAWREERARQRVKVVEDKSVGRVHALLKDAEHASRLRRSEIWREFTRAQEMLTRKLHQQQAILKERFGKLMSNETAAARRYRLMWDRVREARFVPFFLS